MLAGRAVAALMSSMIWWAYGMRNINHVSVPLGRMPVAPGHVYLTFDDGPDSEWTPRILDLLAAANMHATFFVVGRRAQEAPSLLRRVLREGHTVGNHSFDHRHPWLLSSRAARAEVRDGAAAIADVIGRMPQLFRPPHGLMRPAMIDEANALGQSVVLWNRSAVDWGPYGTSKRIAARLADTRPGEIVLMHDAASTHNKPLELLRVLPAFLLSLALLQLESGRVINSSIA
jgi:peptidoglycan/xylan/chitin deacetylase (PgdA/CDA1 family)